MNQNLFAEYQPYIFIVIGLIALVYSIFWTSAKSKLQRTGIPVDGIVFKQRSDNRFNSAFENSSFTNNRITIRFVTQTEEWVTGVIKQDFRIFYTGQYKNGDRIKLYYEENNPSNFYVDTKQMEIVGRLISCLVGLIFLSIGLYQFFV